MQVPGRDWRQKLNATAAREIASRVKFFPAVLFALTGLTVAMGVWLRVSLLGSGSLWMDELWTLDAVSRSFKEMIGARLVSDQSPPLWTMLSWVWLNLLGTYNTAWMRVLPATFGCLGIAAPMVGAAKMRDLRPTLLVMASLLAVSLFTIQYGVEFRAYSMMIGLGSVATVIWAGLLTGALPRSGRWIFGFALSGALAGFGHYYGNVLYGCELLVLLAVLALEQRWRPVLILFAWGFLSVLPVLAWYHFTTPWHANRAVAGPPSFSEIQTWLEYAFGPVTNLLGNRPPGYPEAFDDGVSIARLIAVSILAAVFFRILRRKGRSSGFTSTTVVGACAMAVVVAGICVAWWMSLIAPSSFNVKNLATLLPALFLGAACACTVFPERVRWLTACIAVAALLVSSGMVVSQYGVASLTPPWQAQAGYAGAARALISASQESPGPTLIGLNTTWQWHGQWDAAIRAELGAGQAVSSDAEPLHVIWVDTVADIRPGEVPRGPVVLFSDEGDQREADLFAWAQKTIGSCRQLTYGGPAYGLVAVLRCG